MSDEKCPETRRIGSSIFSRILFSFISPTIRKAKRKGRLQEDEVPEHTMDLDTSLLFKRFDDEWQKQKKSQKPSMVQALVAGRWYLLVATGVGYIVAQATTLAGPLLLKQIVAGLTCRRQDDTSSCDSERMLYMYALGLFIAPLIQALVENNNLYQLDQLGLSFRNALMGAIYRKCLRLNNSALASESTGKIVTLMSNDAQKLQEVVLSIHSIWGAPIYILSIMALLYREIQWASLVGLGVLLVMVPISGFIGRGLGKQRRAIIKFIDRRTSFMAEIINGIRVIKFYNWEQPFKEQVLEVRDKEATILRKIAVYQAMFGLTLFTGPVLVGIASFSAYAGAISELTATKAYTSLALFTLLRFPMAFLPTIIFNVINARVALRRIAGFLNSDEVCVNDPGHHTEGVPLGEVSVSEGDFAWETGKDADADAPPILQGINLFCRPGSLTMVVGAVGSGKSSLLATVFRQISRVKGSVRVGGKLAYVPQSAWIMNETLRENVLLGLPMDDERYQAALTAAQLAADLEQLPDGDLTEIGERGVTLSGGQKQRVSIARAVYADADVIILDDPLSAVDSHVGRALFQDCICGALRGKTVLLVTNALHFLHAADQVAWVRDGRLSKVGTYDEVSADAEFMEIIGSHVVAEDVDTENDSDNTNGEVKTEGAPSSTSDSASRSTGSGIKADPIKTDKASGAVMNNSKVEKGGLTGQEERQVGALSSQVVWKYIAGTGGVLWLTVLLFLYCSEQGSKIITDRWPGLWTQDQFDRGLDDLGFYLGIYAALAVLFGLVTLARSLHFTFGAVRAAVYLHNSLLERVLRLPPSFFDANPSGRILNRFSRDTEIMDAVLPTSLIQVGACITSYFGILIVISIATPWFVLMLPPVTVIYYFIQRYYIPSARELQRLESVTRSPIYSGFSESVNGITTIRSYACEAHFTDMEDRRISCNGLMYLTQRAAAQWLSVRLDCMGLTVLTAAGLLAVASDISPSLAGLSLTYALDLTKFLKFGTRIASKTETDFNSVERIVEYLDEHEEAPEFKDKDPDLGSWPSKGTIDVSKIVMRYRPNLPAVLKQVSFSVAGGEHIGIVGRTGSGKSSLFLVFFRMVEPEAGTVVIDGVDITTIGLAPLRRSLSMIPQDPFMFSGTVRRNLDPFDECTDVEVWQALESVSLKAVIQGLDSQLEAKVSDNGGNFSQGQRQLFCLARALLRKSKVLMMDEATASVDVDTDQLIQKVIREKFGHCTVLTIAHRLNTIMDSDKVLVMDKGDAAEFDSPDKLLQDEHSLFTGLVNKTGQNAARLLRGMAAKASHGRLLDLDPDSTPRNALPKEMRVNVENELYSPEQTMFDEAASNPASDSDGDGASHRTHSQLLPPPVDVEALRRAQFPPRPPSGEAARLSTSSAKGRLSNGGGQPSVGRRSGSGIMDPDGPFIRPRPSAEMVPLAVPPLNISRRRTSNHGVDEQLSGRRSLSARGALSARSNSSVAGLAADSVLAHAAVGIGAGALPLDGNGDVAYPWLAPDSMGFGPDDFQTAFSSGFGDTNDTAGN